MKKILILFAIFAGLANCSYAQNKVKSVGKGMTVIKQPKVKHPLSSLNYVGAGITFDGVWGASDENDRGSKFSSKLGYTLTVGRQFAIKNTRFYYGVEAGINSRGCKLNYFYRDHEFKSIGRDIDFTSHAIMVSPLNFGWRPYITDKIELDLRIGGYASYDLFGSVSAKSYTKNKEEQDPKWDDIVERKDEFGGKFSLGVWYDSKYYGGVVVQGAAGIGFIDTDGDNFGFKVGAEFRYSF